MEPTQIAHENGYLVHIAGVTPEPGNDPRRMDAAAIESELAVLVAHENRRVADERRRREAAEATASELAILLAHEHADRERERNARERAEAEARELAALLLRQSDRTGRGRFK